MSFELRASLWNVVVMFVWEHRDLQSERYEPSRIINFFKKLWFDFFKRPITQMPETKYALVSEVEKWFFECRWHEAYDFLEAVVTLRQRREFDDAINFVLARELAHVRLINGQFAPITGSEEIAAIEAGIAVDNRFGSVSEHLQAALSLLSNRQTPDYRNSIKESISAVEAMARAVSGKEKATLDDALRVLAADGNLHPALRKTFGSLYGYAGDADVIRHAMMGKPNLSAHDAKFMLIVCSAFTNYLKANA